MAKQAKRTTTKKSAARRPARKSRTRYSDQERERILAAARSQGLTAVQVQKQFGVTPVTYYSWRKRAQTRGHDRAVAAGAVAGRTLAKAANAADMIRDELRQMIRRMIPEVIATELGGKKPRGRRRG